MEPVDAAPAERVRRLRAAMEAGLPGVEAQLRMAPRPRPGWYPGEIPDDARDGAGLVLLFPHHRQLHLLLTVRPRHLPQHAGQVSLPGGAREAGESITEAALREANEEVGLDPEGVEVLGRLTPLHIPVSGFALYPVVAHHDGRPDMVACEREVERILEVPLRQLEDAASIAVEPRIFRGESYEVPYFAVDGEKVWGATAMILAELLWLLGSPPAPFE